jgi:hypothetical protein
MAIRRAVQKSGVLTSAFLPLLKDTDLSTSDFCILYSLFVPMPMGSFSLEQSVQAKLLAAPPSRRAFATGKAVGLPEHQQG